MSRRLVLAVVLLLGAGCAQSTAHIDQTVDSPEAMHVRDIEKPQTFEERIARIAAEVKDLTTTSALFGPELFREVYEDPSSYLKEAAELYHDPEVPRYHKMITGYAMQQLPLEDFVWLVGHVTSLTERGDLDPLLLETLAFPTLDWGAQLAMYYEAPEVQRLLTRMLELDTVSEETHVYIREEVMSGHAKQDVERLRRAGQLR